MNAGFVIILIGLLSALALRADPAGPPNSEDTYTITSVMELTPPFDPTAMNDEFQQARVLSQTSDLCRVEITYYPLHEQAVGENTNWQKEDASMQDYLRPTPTENWNEAMRRDLLAELAAAGINPDRMSDKELVTEVSRWAMKRARSTEAFAIWTICYTNGLPAVFPPLRKYFEGQKPNPAWTDQQMFEREALGRSMFDAKVHGSCTSSSIYLATIFRALGIPTRIVFCIPPFDPTDGAQAKTFYENVHHNQVRETVRAALDGSGGFQNHLFNEVYVGHHWVRLNYTRLGQPILDRRYFGLLTHIYTCTSVANAPLAQTWGMRYFDYPDCQPRLSSFNPYRLLSVHDHFGTNSQIENPAAATAELRTVTIIGLYLPDSPQIPKWARESLKQNRHETDLLLAGKEWVDGSYQQMRAFTKRAGREFILTSPSHQKIRARLTGLNLSAGAGTFQAYGLRIFPEDRDKIAEGEAYRIAPINTSDVYRWEIGPDLNAITFPN